MHPHVRRQAHTFPQTCLVLDKVPDFASNFLAKMHATSGHRLHAWYTSNRFANGTSGHMHHNWHSSTSSDWGRRHTESLRDLRGWHACACRGLPPKLIGGSVWINPGIGTINAQHDLRELGVAFSKLMFGTDAAGNIGTNSGFEPGLRGLCPVFILVLCDVSILVVDPFCHDIVVAIFNFFLHRQFSQRCTSLAGHRRGGLRARIRSLIGQKRQNCRRCNNQYIAISALWACSSHAKWGTS
jgi:hypothetical protein